MHELPLYMRLSRRIFAHCLMLLSVSPRNATPGDHAPDGFEYNDNRRRFNKIKRAKHVFSATLGYSNYNVSPSSEYSCTKTRFFIFPTGRTFFRIARISILTRSRVHSILTTRLPA